MDLSNSGMNLSVIFFKNFWIADMLIVFPCIHSNDSKTRIQGKITKAKGRSEYNKFYIPIFKSLVPRPKIGMELTKK